MKGREKAFQCNNVAYSPLVQGGVKVMDSCGWNLKFKI